MGAWQKWRKIFFKPHSFLVSLSQAATLAKPLNVSGKPGRIPTVVHICKISKQSGVNLKSSIFNKIN